MERGLHIRFGLKLAICSTCPAKKTALPAKFFLIVMKQMAQHGE